MKQLFLVILTFSFEIGLANDCLTGSNWEEEFEASDVVFLGRVISINDTSYQIVVLENYKRAVADTLTGILRTDSSVPKRGSIWLIYGLGEKNTFIVPACSGSKSLDHPYGWHDVFFPLPPPKGLDHGRPLTEIYAEIQVSRSINEFYFEVETLREKVRQSDVKLLQDTLGELRKNNNNIVGNNSVTLGLIIVFAIILLALIILQLAIIKRLKK